MLSELTLNYSYKCNNTTIDFLIYNLSHSISLEANSDHSFSHDLSISLISAVNNGLFSFITAISGFSGDLDLNFTGKIVKV